MIVSKRDFYRQELADNDPDPSYLEQEGWEDRLAEYEKGYFGFIGICAAVDLPFRYGNGFIKRTIHSPGCWGIESDSDENYLQEVFREECNILADMIRELGVEVIDAD